MSILEIKIYPDPILKEISTPVEQFDEALGKLLDDMHETMIAANGIGIAAPQIGVSKQIAVIDVSEERNNKIEIINPKIVWSDGRTSSEEGCLSIPDYRDTVPRFTDIVVQAKDRHGKDLEIKAEELLAICLQHEIDHLNGVLFIDRLSRLKRELFKRWHKKRSDG